MKLERVLFNVLIYFILIDVYLKGGLYREVMEVFKEFKGVGLKVDVVFYSGFIDVLCKNGFVELVVFLLDEMIKEGIRFNVVTYNIIIDVFGRLIRVSYLVNVFGLVDEFESEILKVELFNDVNVSNFEGEYSRVMEIFG